jgi:hypothetical protein
MPDQAPPVPRLFRALQAVLVGITLVALWLVAWKVRDAKVEARSGGRERIDQPFRPPAGPLPLARGTSLRAGHFLVRYPDRDGVLEVARMDGELLARFEALRPGDVRAWQELRIEVKETSPQAHELALELRPGAACRGPGLFRAVKPGLRIEVDGTAYTVVRWDPASGGVVRLDDGTEREVAPAPGGGLELLTK